MNARLRMIILSVSTPVLAFALIGGFFGQASAGEDTYTHLRIFEDVVSLISNNYVEDVELERVMGGAMRGLADGLDPASSHLSPDEVAIVEGGTLPDDNGLGLEVTRQYYLRVVAARDGSPAARAGLMTGDFIRGIDRTPTRDLSLFTGQRMLAGEPGTSVRLTVIRGSAAEPHVLDLVREPTPAIELSARIVQPGVGYVRIPAFDDTVPDLLEQRITEMQQAGATRLVIDIRRNAGGRLASGVEAARRLVADGTLARRTARDEVLESFDAQGEAAGATVPIALLVNRGTSGPAELFAAALSGNDRAALVGERTLGRTAEQRLVRLPDGSGLWLSWAQFEGPGGLAIHGTGLSPTIAVDEPDVEFGQPMPEEDPVLDAAIEHLAARQAA